MATFKQLVFSFFVLSGVLIFGWFPLAQGKGLSNESLVTENCLECICHASTGCNITMKCVSVPSDQEYCGPFSISKPYWIDAGKYKLAKSPDDESDSTFHDCVLNPICAVKTVRTYTARFAQDCNNDGIVNCEDLAIIHKLGGWSCASESVIDSIYYKRFVQCQANKPKEPPFNVEK